MVERTSKLVRLVKVPNKTADHVSKALIDSLEPMRAFVEKWDRVCLPSKGKQPA